MIRFLKYIAIFGVAAAMAGCSLFKKGATATEPPVETVPLYTPVTESAESPEEAISGKWYVRTVGTITLSGIEDDEWPYLDFVASEQRFYGSDGCNVLNGEYKTTAECGLTLSHVASTMRLCEGDSLSYPMQSALNSVGAFTVVKGKGGVTELTLKSRNDKVVMTLSKSDIDFLNGAWQVVAVNEKDIDVAEARLIFDIPAGRVSGNASCNSLNGDISRDPKVENSLQISNLLTTLRSCPNMSVESALLIALEEVVTAKEDGKDYVKLLNASGKTSVKLKRLTRKDF